MLMLFDTPASVDVNDKATEALPTGSPLGCSKRVTKTVTLLPTHTSAGWIVTESMVAVWFAVPAETKGKPLPENTMLPAGDWAATTVDPCAIAKRESIRTQRNAVSRFILPPGPAI
jgi:hypothetical protein